MENLVALGQEGPDTSTYESHSTLTKIKPNGDIIWLRRYIHDRWDAHNYLWDFIQTKDKGFLLIGDEFGIGKPTKDVWLLKVDSNGCKPGCRILEGDTIKKPDDTLSIGSQVLSNNNDVLLYPNPASSQLIIKTQNKGQTQYKLFDFNGQLLLSSAFELETEIDVAFIERGVYLLELVFGDSVVVKKVVLE